MDFDEAIQAGLKRMDDIYARLRSKIEFSDDDISHFFVSMEDLGNRIRSIKDTKQTAAMWKKNL